MLSSSSSSSSLLLSSARRERSRSQHKSQSSADQVSPRRRASSVLTATEAGSDGDLVVASRSCSLGSRPSRAVKPRRLRHEPAAQRCVLPSVLDADLFRLPLDQLPVDSSLAAADHGPPPIDRSRSHGALNALAAMAAPAPTPTSAAAASSSSSLPHADRRDSSPQHSRPLSSSRSTDTVNRLALPSKSKPSSKLSSSKHPLSLKSSPASKSSPSIPTTTTTTTTTLSSSSSGRAMGFMDAAQTAQQSSATVLLSVEDEVTAAHLVGRLLSMSSFDAEERQTARIVFTVHEYFVTTEELLSLVLSMFCPNVKPIEGPLLQSLDADALAHANSCGDMAARGRFLIDVWISTDMHRLCEGQAGALLAAVRSSASSGDDDDCEAARLISSRMAAARLDVQSLRDDARLSHAAMLSTGVRTTDSWTRVVLLEKLKVHELAFVLTWSEFLLFAHIPMREFLLKRQSKIDQSPNYHLAIDYFNKIVAWLQSVVVLQPNPDSRAALLAKFIDLATALKRLNNFSAFCQLVYALDSQPIARLTDTWSLVPPPARDLLRSYAELVTPLNNFRQLRALVQSAAPPMLPPLFLAGKDIFSLEEATDTHTADGKISWKKLRKIGQLIIATLDACKHPYPVPDQLGLELETLQFFARFLIDPSPRESPDRISKLSILCQPMRHRS